MKASILIAICTALLPLVSLHTPGIAQPLATARISGDSDNISWEGYGNALDAAEKADKKVLVDVYTDWCGWCKRMDRDVYTNADVKAYLAKHFITVKLNAESSTAHNVKGTRMTEKEIARKYGIRSFPTTLFLGSDGQPITTVPGYVPAKTFLLVLRYISEEAYKTTPWDEYSKQNG